MTGTLYLAVEFTVIILLLLHF